MDRRNFVRGMMAAAVCPVCARMALAAEGAPWSYAGETGPEHWGALADENAACSVGARQSPVDIAEAIRAELPPLRPDWKPGGTMVNNGHTIQVAVPAGSTLARGDRLYTLVQFHFHAPSEHLVAGRPAAMEVHFVHRAVEGSGLGVLGVLMEPGDANPAFARLAVAFPGEPGGMAATDVDPAGLLPPSLAYWSYDSHDYERLPAPALLAKIRSRPPRAGDVVLMHDDNMDTVDALAELLPEWARAGLAVEAMPVSMPGGAARAASA